LFYKGFISRFLKYAQFFITFGIFIRIQDMRTNLLEPNKPGEEIIEIYRVLYGDDKTALEIYKINHSNKEWEL